MKRTWTWTVIVAVLMLWGLPAGITAQEAGQCYFQATEDIYLKIYHLDKDGVEEGTYWSGHLPEGGTKSYNAPHGRVGYATKKNPDDPWEGTQGECFGGEAIQIP